jgi:hypothetical protein
MIVIILRIMRIIKTIRISYCDFDDDFDIDVDVDFGFDSDFDLMSI